MKLANLPLDLAPFARRHAPQLLQETLYALTALQLLTRIPVSSLPGFDRTWLDRSVAYFPLVGLVVGGISAAVLLAASTFWLSPVPAVLAIAACVAVTGALHEDGLADTADGLVGGQSREQRLAIMKDSRIGTYGACALVGVLAIKVASLSLLAPTDAAWALLAACTASRIVPVLASALVPYAGAPGEAKVAPLQPSANRMVIAVVTGLVPLLAFPLAQAVAALLVAGAASAVVLAKAMRSIGGQTGDVLGASLQVFEATILLVLAGNWA